MTDSGEPSSPSPSSREMPRALRELKVGQKLGRFKVRGKLGQGAAGWVVRAEDMTLQRPVALKLLPFESQRDESHRAAAEQFLQPRDVIYLDGSSTALQFAKIIPALDLTVLTNAHGVIDVLKNREGVEVIATGGRFDSLNDCYGGAMASQALTRYRVKTAFFSGNGIDVQRGISESDEDQADLKAFALRFVERAVFLADSTKIGLRSTYFFADLEGIDVWITDSSASEKKLNPFRNKVRSIIVA